MKGAKQELTNKTGHNTPKQFHAYMEKGEYGEYKIKKFLHEYFGDNIDFAEDKSNDKNFQKADIDLLLQFGGGTITPMEVKNDTYTTGNMFYEIISRSEPETPDVPGCMITTEAEVLFYMFEQLDITLILDMKRLREWVAAYFDCGGHLEKKVVTNPTYSSVGYIIPVEKMMGADKGWAPVHGIRMMDLSTGKQMTFEEFEQRRLLVETINDSEADEPFAVREKYWQIKNSHLWPDYGVLSFATKKQREKYKKTITL